MKTPEEIKNALDLCSRSGCPDCAKCACDGNECCLEEKSKDALAYIQQLENAVEFYSNTAQMLDAKSAKLESCIAQVELERDAAVECVGKAFEEIIKPYEAIWKVIKTKNVFFDYFMQLRGVCPENTKEENK